MDDSAAVKVLDASEDLVEEDLDVVGREMLRGDDDLVEITLHEFGDEVDFLEKVNVRGLKRKTKISFLVIVDSNQVLHVTLSGGR